MLCTDKADSSAESAGSLPEPASRSAIEFHRPEILPQPIIEPRSPDPRPAEPPVLIVSGSENDRVNQVPGLTGSPVIRGPNGWIFLKLSLSLDLLFKAWLLPFHGDNHPSLIP